MDTIQMIGSRIAEIRKQKSLTQEALAGKMSVSGNTAETYRRFR